MPYSNCDATVTGVRSDTERQALTTSYGADHISDLHALGTLYSICAESDPSKRTYLENAGPSQTAEISGALILCPSHPNRGFIEDLLAKAGGSQDPRTSGRLFGPGVLLVGSQVQPGTYVASNGQGCYWERQDRNGNIIENKFYDNAARVQATISATDYAFNSRDCGEWKPV
jgi:hypothetical protein